MLGKAPNKVYNPFLKVGLGYKNPERLKKAVAAQPKIYDGEMLHSTSLKINSPDSEETLEDAEESQLKMRNKMVKLNYEKLNALYETFVPQQEPSVEQTYFSIPSTSNDSSETKEVTSDLSNVTLLEDRKRIWISDSQNSLREFYKTNKVAEKSLKENVLQTEIDRLLEVSLSREIRDWVIISVQEQKNKMLRNELEKSSSDSKDIQANLLKRIKILENDFKRSQAQKSVLLKTQVDSIVKERENIKLEYQKFFNSIKATCTQHQKEIDKLIEHVNQKTYAYADVRAQNQDLLMTISELKNKLKTVDKGKNVNTKFDKFETWGTLLCVTPLPKNIAIKAKKVSITKVNPDRSKPVTSHSIPKNEQSKKQSVNVIARGMYRITKIETQTLDSKSNINVSNSKGVESFNSVRRPKSKDNKSKDRVLKNTNDKRPSVHVRKMSSSVSIDSNKREQCI
ncbi:hypothetical protein Tco_1037071 [Tanacetum coccineum]